MKWTGPIGRRDGVGVMRVHRESGTALIMAYKIQTPGKFPEDYILQLQHGESLKTKKFNFF
jgi:hypothetical protein